MTGVYNLLDPFLLQHWTGRKDDQAAPDGQTGTGGGPDGPAAVPRVIWIARTHDQMLGSIVGSIRSSFREVWGEMFDSQTSGRIHLAFIAGQAHDVRPALVFPGKTGELFQAEC